MLEDEEDCPCFPDETDCTLDPEAIEVERENEEEVERLERNDLCGCSENR